MEATQEFSSVPKVQLQQKYWVTEDSKAKLLTVGAKCLEIVTHSEHYYDTTSDDLAMAQLWLSQRNQQWHLILESQQQMDRDNIASQNKPENIQHTKATVCEEKKQAQFQPNNLDDQQLDLNETDSTNICAAASSAYTELTEEKEIITHLAGFLNINLKFEEEAKMTMEDFLQKADIQHYANNHVLNQITYKLCDRYTIIIQKDESSLKESATILLDMDIFNICKGFEEMEKLANYLEFEHQALQSEQELLM